MTQRADRAEVQNLQLTHRAERAESELSDLRSFLSQLLAASPPSISHTAASPPATSHTTALPHAISHTAVLPGPISPAAAMLATSSEAAATPAAMTQPAPILAADDDTQAAASPLVPAHAPSVAAAAAAAAAVALPSNSQPLTSSHGISQADTARSPGPGLPQTCDLPSVLPKSPPAQAQSPNGQFQSLTGQVQSLKGHIQYPQGQLQSIASPMEPGLPAADLSLSVPNSLAMHGTGLNPALGFDVTPNRSTDPKGSSHPSSGIASQPQATGSHTHTGPSPLSGISSGVKGSLQCSSCPPMGSSSPTKGTSSLSAGRSSPIKGTPILCKPAVSALPLIGSPSQLTGQPAFLPVNSASQLSPLHPPCTQPADSSDQSHDMQGLLEHDFDTAQLKDPAVPTQHQEQHVGDASPAQQAARTPSVSCNHSMPSRLCGQSDTTDCSIDPGQQASRRTGHSTLVINKQTTPEAASICTPASTESTSAAAVEEELQGASGAGEDSTVGQRSGGLATLASAITKKHMPAAIGPRSPHGNPPQECGPEPGASSLTGPDEADANVLQQAGTVALTHGSADRSEDKPADRSAYRSAGRAANGSADSLPTSIARVLRQHPHEHTSRTHSMIADKAPPPAAAAADVSIEAANTDKLTHMTDNPAELAPAAGSFCLAAEDSPSSEEGASQKGVSYTAAELFCMVSDKGSQDAANSPEVATTLSQASPTHSMPPKGRGPQLDACDSRSQAVNVASQLQQSDHVPQLEAVVQDQTRLIASPQQLDKECSMRNPAALSSPGLYKQDAQGSAEAASPALDRQGKDHEQTGNASANHDTAQQADAHEKENRPMIEFETGSGGLAVWVFVPHHLVQVMWSHAKRSH